MFTGIVTAVGIIESVEQSGDTRVAIACDWDVSDVDIGASIACSGVCLTVVERDGPAGGEGAGGRFVVDVSEETRRRTVPGMWEAGRRLNLERALRMGDELGGHLVTGHVDTVGTVRRVREEGGSRAVTIGIADAFAPFVAPKGSITVDGVSLTVNEVEDDADGTSFAINLIPHTGEVTTLGSLDEGAEVNLEIDTIARYLQRLVKLRG